MNEILKVHESITTVDRKFTATLDSTCNLVVNTYRGAGKNRSTVQVRFIVLSIAVGIAVAIGIVVVMVIGLITMIMVIVFF